MTTGSTVVGLLDGMNHGAGFSGLASDALIHTIGNPNDIVTCQTGSDLAVDLEAGSLFMGLAINGSTWICLGSVAA